MLLSGKPDVYYPLGEQARKPGTAEWRFPNEVLQGQAIDFDGTDEIEIPETTLSGEFSISAWVNPDTFAAPQSMLFGGNSSNAYKIEFNGPTIINIKIAGSNTGVYSPTSWTLNKWQHLLITRNSSNLVTIYRNGVSWGTTTKSGDFIFDRISGFNNSASHFDGRLSNIAIWDTDQSANKDNIYNYGAPQTSYTVAPTAWYKLDKTSKFTGLNPNWHNALSFDYASGNYITVDNSSGDFSFGTSPFSISLWFNGESFPGAYTALLGSHGSGSNSSFWAAYVHDSVGVVIFHGGQLIGGGGPISINEWYHYAVTRDTSGNLITYLNGVPVNTATGKTGTFNSASTIRIADDLHNANPSFDGKLSNVAVYKQAISAEDIKYLYNGGTPQTNISFEPTSWYKLDNLTTGIQDSGSASNNGTNNGATAVSSSVAVDEWVFENTVQSQTPNWTSALSFDGSSVVSINPITLDATNGMTLSLWLKCGTQSGLVFLCSSGGTGGTLSQFNFRITSDGSLLSYFNGSVNFNALLTGLATDTWNHVVVTVNYATGDVIGYKNTVQGPNTLTYGSARTTAKLSCIGAATSTGSYGMVGEISNVQVWQSVLSTNEIKTLYNNGQPQSTAYSSPISWWKLDDTANGIKDSVGSNDLTNNGATEIQTNVWTPRLNADSDTLPSTALVSSDLQFNSAYSSFSLDFDGVDDYINCGDSDTFTFGNGTTDSPFSVSAWFNADTLTANERFTIGKYDSGPEWLFQARENFIVFALYDSSNSSYYLSTMYSATIDTGVWRNVIFTYDGSSNATGCKMYINGSLVTTTTTKVGYTAMGNKSSDLKIGARSGKEFDGKIDEVSIFNKVLNQAEITSIYNNGYPKDLTALSPISWWRLGEDAYFNGNDFIIPNQITGAPNGTSNGMPATALIADAPGSYAAGLGSSLALDDRLGDAPNSIANSLSFNMTPENRISYPAGYTPTQVDNVYSMTFDGTSAGYIDFSSSILFDSEKPFSFSAWVNLDGYSPAYPTIVRLATDQNQDFIIGLSDQTNYTGVFFGTNIGFAKGTTSGDISADFINTWKHVCLTYNGLNKALLSNYKIFVDGTEIALTTAGPFATLTGNINTIGYGGYSNRFFNGKIDEVAIFDYALSARQIKEDIYNATTSGKTADLNNNSNLTAPIAWYRMGD